jgi:hypothetical protein
MTAVTSRKADRELLVRLAEALSVSQGRLRRDPCGDWIIGGSRGHILTDGINAFAYLPGGTVRRWERAKRTLNFMRPTQDGDTEGILKLQAMPTATQAEALRKLLGLRKASPLSDERRAALVSVGFPQAKPALQAGFIASGGVAAANAPSSTENANHDPETAVSARPFVEISGPSIPASASDSTYYAMEART